MTPAARVAAAIDILDAIIAGAPGEKVLTNWARASRYAGSGDRAAIRDHVFDALRCRRSYAMLGGAETGRGLMIGALRSGGVALDDIFTGTGYGPAVLSAAEASQRDLGGVDEATRLDCPDWLLPLLKDSLGVDIQMVLTCMQSRAPLFLRANLARTSRAAALTLLAGDGIGAEPHALSASAIRVTENPRRFQNSAALKQGLVEIQDAASQAVVDFLPLNKAARVLDYCAGGGGKSLAIAARGAATITAHDALPQRMRDLPARAERAGVAVNLAEADALAPAAFDLVLCDVPCSGSGAWRRSPEGKWALTEDRLGELCALQQKILEKAASYVAEGGVLAYATCSLLEAENNAQTAEFCRQNPGWLKTAERHFTPLQGGDGFYVALMVHRLIDA